MSDTTNIVNTPIVINPKGDNTQLILDTIENLVNLGIGVAGVVSPGSVPIALVGGVKAVQLVTPYISQLIATMKDNTKVYLNLSTVTTAEVVAAAKADIDTGWPELSFMPNTPVSSVTSTLKS